MTWRDRQWSWRKSTYSDAQGNGNCVEIAHHSATVAVRDSKAPRYGTLTLPPTAWQAFTHNSRHA